jgi:hypothetical protein
LSFARLGGFFRGTPLLSVHHARAFVALFHVIARSTGSTVVESVELIAEHAREHRTIVFRFTLTSTGHGVRPTLRA